MLVAKRAVVDKRLVEFYEEAYDCAPGCHCEQIMIEYNQVLKWQDDLSDRIVEYNTNLLGLIENEQQIIESCPAYIYDIDGNAYFDYEAPVVVKPIIEEVEPEIIGGMDTVPEFLKIDEVEPVIDGGNDTFPTDEQDIEDVEEDIQDDMDKIFETVSNDSKEAVALDEETESLETRIPSEEVAPGERPVDAE